MGVQDPAEGGGLDLVAEAAQFALDPHYSPGRILGSQARDQPHHVVWCRWATWRFGLAPRRGDQPAVPAKQRSRRDDPMGAKRLA
jgi:hypothetical protein